MSYRIQSIERIDPASLPEPMPAGFARWRAVVDFWDGEAVGPPHLTDEFVLERPTQISRPAAGDQWELVSAPETLVRLLVELVDQCEPHYVTEIRKGTRGFRGESNQEHHGRVKANDAIARNAAVRKLIGSIRKRGV